MRCNDLFCYTLISLNDVSFRILGYFDDVLPEDGLRMRYYSTMDCTNFQDAKESLRLLVELPIHNAPQSARNTRDMILHRAQIEFDTETQLVDEMIDALAGSGLPWLSEHEHMDVEPGINDFDT